MDENFLALCFITGLEVSELHVVFYGGFEFATVLHRMIQKQQKCRHYFAFSEGF